MIAFSRILFPADLSEQAQQSAPFVAAMARRFSSELLVLHVYEQSVSYYPVPVAATWRAVRSEQERRQEQQQRFESFLSAFFGDILKKSRFDEGDPAECIVSCAREFRPDLIMMPTRGYGRFRRILLGSVTAKVLHDAECPVWTGVHTDQMWQAAAAGWHRFLCAVDENPRDVALLKWAAQFTCEQRAELHAVHAVHAAAPIQAGHETASLSDFLMRVARESLARMQADAGTNLEVRLALGPVGRVVREAALEYNADLVLLGRGAIRKGFGRLRSSAYEVIREAPCPVISL